MLRFDGGRGDGHATAGRVHKNDNVRRRTQRGEESGGEIREGTSGAMSPSLRKRKSWENGFTFPHILLCNAPGENGGGGYAMLKLRGNRSRVKLKIFGSEVYCKKQLSK